MKKERHPLLKEFVDFLIYLSTRTRRVFYMPGDGRYQPEELIPFLGYDQWAAWLIIVEWFWMITLAKIGVMPKEDSKNLTNKNLFRLLRNITTTMQDKTEKATRHDVLALLELMRKYLPQPLHRWLHFCATSYDIINTAYALQIALTFENVFWPKLIETDQLWRKRIGQYASTLQAGRTHLQTALPVTVGLWLAYLHSRFADCAREALSRSRQVPGKFSGAVGTFASQAVFIKSREAERIMMEMLGLPTARICTQITPPEGTARYYHELVLLSAVTANLGDDVRTLQSSRYGELITTSSSSSAMPHKTANPIAAENDAGMHVSVIAENLKVTLTLTSNLQRDLRWSNVMRSYSAVMVYHFQQLKTTLRILKSLEVNEKKCRENFDEAGKLVVAELLHLALQKAGAANTHHAINQGVIPLAIESGDNLLVEMDRLAANDPELDVSQRWQSCREDVALYLEHPESYIGYARELAIEETDNELCLAA